MDQFESFHRIACWYPNAHWHTFREGCNAYPLRIGAVEYHRAYSHCEREEIARFFGCYEIAAVELGLRDWQVLKIAVPPAGGGAP